MWGVAFAKIEKVGWEFLGIIKNRTTVGLVLYCHSGGGVGMCKVELLLFFAVKT